MTLITYKWGGHDPATGLDCLGYASWLRTEHRLPPLNLAHPAIAQFYRRYRTEESANHMAVLKLAQQISSQPDRLTQDWDLVLIRVKKQIIVMTLLDDQLWGIEKTGPVQSPAARLRPHVMAVFLPF